MAVTLYTFEKLCNSGRLSQEIQASSITIAEDHIETVASPATTKVYMKAALSEGEETTLNTLVDEHENTPLPDQEARLITTGKTDIATGREVFTPAAFAVNTDYEVKATGYAGTATAGQLTNLDFAVGSEDRYINGLALLLKNHADDDTIGLSVVDVDNVLGYGAGLVLKTFGTNWNVNASVEHQGLNSFNYAARIPANMYIRLAYNSTGGANVKVRVNFLLHKKVT